MNLANAVTVTSPLVLQRTKQYANAYGFRQLEKRIHYLPLPVSVGMRYNGEQKRNRIICVGRWLPEDWPEKGPKLLFESLSAFLGKRLDYEALVVGRGASALRQASFYPKHLPRTKLQLVEFVPNDKLSELFAESQISICSSFHESFHIASFEAACCGCSIVALRSPDLPALQFLAESDGTLASEETSGSFAAALDSEAAAWEGQLRNPRIISDKWGQKVHSDKVAGACLRLLIEEH
jgi:glycosyltransferase involved in cell wall biosynthesis